MRRIRHRTTRRRPSLTDASHRTSSESGASDERVVGLQGDLDGSRQRELVELCHRSLRGGGRGLALDLTEVGLLSSAGMGVLLLAWREMTCHGGRLVIFGLSPAMRVLLELSRVQRVIDVCDSREHALELLLEEMGGVSWKR